MDRWYQEPVNHLSLDDLRAEFPALDGNLAYFDWGATGLLARSTRAELDRYYAVLADCPGSSSLDVHVAYAKVRNEARQQMARMLGGAADDVALVESTTQGLQIASECIRLQRGDNVLVFELDYPAVALPWVMRQRADGSEVRFVRCPEGRFDARELVARIDDRTRVVAVSTICWTTGALTDLDAILAETSARGIFLVVDAIQTFGVVPFDVRKSPASFVTAGGLKWLCATPGSGFLWVNPLVAARSRPARFGFWSGQPSTHRSWQDWLMSGVASLEDEVLFQARGRTFETGGTPSYAAGIGLLTMGRLLERAGVPLILDRVRLLADELIRGLDSLGLEIVTPRDPALRANMVVFRLPGGREAEIALVQRLAERKVAVNVRWMKGHGGVRASIHGMNTHDDVARLLAELRTVSGA
jgi:selenocysteine lyase/cysteine desulfurase